MTRCLTAALRAALSVAKIRCMVASLMTFGALRTCSFGFRPKRAAHDAPQVLLDEAFGGRAWVVETEGLPLLLVPA